MPAGRWLLPNEQQLEMVEVGRAAPVIAGLDGPHLLGDEPDSNSKEPQLPRRVDPGPQFHVLFLSVLAFDHRELVHQSGVDVDGGALTRVSRLVVGVEGTRYDASTWARRLSHAPENQRIISAH